MNRLMIFLALLFCSTGLIASDMNYLITNMKVNNSWVLELDDHSCWTPHTMKENTQSWSEWWNSQTPEQPPAEFLCDVKLWKQGATVLIHEVERPLITGYGYVLENTDTGEKVYAKSGPTKCLPRRAYVDALIEGLEAQSVSVVRQLGWSDQTLLLLNDDKVYEIYSFGKNRQSWSEWWNGYVPEQPDEEFLFKRSEWRAGDRLHLYKNGTCLVVKHPTKEQIAYLQPVSIDTLLTKYQNELKSAREKSHAAGYTKGQAAGYSQGYARGRSAPNDNEFRTGYQRGYQDGANGLSYSAVRQRADVRRSRAPGGA